MRVEEAITAFIQFVASDRSASTVRSYRGRLGLLQRAFGTRALSSLTPDELQAWLQAQRTFPDGREKAPDTIRLTVITFELWQSWLVKRRDIPQAWLEKQAKPGGRKREMLPNADETKQLLSQAQPDFLCAYRALRLTGARPGELARSQIEDIDRRAGLIVLQQHKTAKKTGRPRRIAIGHPALVQLINEAIGERTTGPIFLRANGRPWTTESLSAAYRRARVAAKLPAGLVLYLARHEHATQLYKSTGDLKAVADALGHSQLNTTMRYTRTDADTLKRNQGRFEEGLG